MTVSLGVPFFEDSVEIGAPLVLVFDSVSELSEFVHVHAEFRALFFESAFFSHLAFSEGLDAFALAFFGFVSVVREQSSAWGGLEIVRFGVIYVVC